MLLSELPNERLRHVPVPQELTVGEDHHALLAPRQHHVRPPLVLHEPRNGRPDDRDDDVIFLVPLEGVDVEHRVFPGETRVLERVLDGVSLSVIRSDDFEFFELSEVAFSDFNCGLDFTFVLNNGQILSACAMDPCSEGAIITVQLTPILTSSPLLTSTKRQQVGVRILCSVRRFES